MKVYTTDSVAASGKLCDAAAGLTKDQAAVAAMVTEAFINGMNTQARIVKDSAPGQART